MGVRRPSICWLACFAQSFKQHIAQTRLYVRNAETLRVSCQTQQRQTALPTSPSIDTTFYKKTPHKTNSVRVGYWRCLDRFNQSSSCAFACVSDCSRASLFYTSTDLQLIKKNILCILAALEIRFLVFFFFISAVIRKSVSIPLKENGVECDVLKNCHRFAWA